MEKLKIFVRTKEESQEAQSLFFKLGLYWFGSKDELHSNRIGVLFTTNLHGKDIMTFSLEGDAELPNHKEITLSELRDMVVLKRNNVGDATHITADDVWKFYIGHDTYCYERKNGVIGWHKEDSKSYGLKPIEKKEMKEYLVKTDNGDYLYTKNSSNIEASRVIEIPEGVNVYARCNIFGDCKLLPCSIDGDWEILWQRETLNDKVASAEKHGQEEKAKSNEAEVTNVSFRNQMFNAYGFNGSSFIGADFASGESHSSMSQTTFRERELCKSSLNHTVANAFRAIRGDMVRLTEDDVRLIQELTELAKAHGDVWK